MREIKIPFQPDMKELVLSGDKTCTSRNQFYGETGDYFYISGHKFILKSISSVPLGYVARNLYKEEGFINPAGFIKKWNEIHPIRRYDPCQTIWLHEFIEIK
jgi:hypothetical protein